MRLFLLLLHGFVAFLLLGAVSHQAFALWWPSRQPRTGWWNALRGVHGDRYVSAVITLFVAQVILGALLYAPFVAQVRFQFLDTHVPWATGLFEMKEHAAAIGLALLPAYWGSWKEPAGSVAPKRAITTVLAVLAWWSFFIGHVVNNVRGL